MSSNTTTMTPSAGLVNTVALAGIAGVVVSLALVFTNMAEQHHAAFNTTHFCKRQHGERERANRNCYRRVQ